MRFFFLACFLPFSSSFIPLSTSRSQLYKLDQDTLQTKPFHSRQDLLSQTPYVSSTALNFAVPDGAQEAWTAYNDALQTNPLLVKSLTAGVILGAADLAGQALEDYNSGDKTEIDFARTARFAFFGLVLQVRSFLHMPLFWTKLDQKWWISVSMLPRTSLKAF